MRRECHLVVTLPLTQVRTGESDGLNLALSFFFPNAPRTVDYGALYGWMQAVRDETMGHLHWRRALAMGAKRSATTESLAAFTLQELEEEVARRRAAADSSVIRARLRESDQRLAEISQQCPHASSAGGRAHSHAANERVEQATVDGTGRTMGRDTLNGWG